MASGLDEAGVLEVLTLPDDDLPDALQLAHEVRMRWCGPDVEVEGIVSVKTGGCPEDCHFCCQSGAVHLPRPGGLAGHPGAGRGGPADRGDRGDRVLHRGRRARARTSG